MRPAVIVCAALLQLAAAQRFPDPIRGPVIRRQSAGPPSFGGSSFGGSSFGGSSSFGSSNPCSSDPCGPNTRCEVSNSGVAQCHCLDNYVPDDNTIEGCKPQCVSDFECGDDYSCKGQKCVRVCSPGACGLHATCDARNHRRICSCPDGFSGNAESACEKDFPAQRADPPAVAFDACSLGQCAENAECRNDAHNNRAVCSCRRGYEGDATKNCRKLECITHSDCDRSEVCDESNVCVNPCVPASKYCGTGAVCSPKNHAPVCSCPTDYTGNPLVNCRRLTAADYCTPTPCGDNTNCEFNGMQAVCSCIENYIGDPLTGCRAECITDHDCGRDSQCRQNRCINPCAYGECGDDAYCKVNNHVVTCTCPTFFQGNPRVRCYAECTQHSDCHGSNQVCGSELRCHNPCDNACGVGADCEVRKDQGAAICSCPKGFTGHPYDRCRPFGPEDLCTPTTCGVDAECTPGQKVENGRRTDAAVCTCKKGYIGNPKQACRRGDCLTPRDCPNQSDTCHNYICQDACNPETGYVCGEGSLCDVNPQTRAPTCSCPLGYTGDPREFCEVLTRHNFRGGRT